MTNEFMDFPELRDGGDKCEAVWLCVELCSMRTLKIQTGFNYWVAHLGDQTKANVSVKALALPCC